MHVCNQYFSAKWDQVLCAKQEERLELLSTLQQLPLKIRTEEQEAILQGLSPAEMGAHPDHLQPCVLESPLTTQIWMHLL